MRSVKRVCLLRILIKYFFIEWKKKCKLEPFKIQLNNKYMYIYKVMKITLSWFQK